MRPETLLVFDGQSLAQQPATTFPTDRSFPLRTLALLAPAGKGVGHFVVAKGNTSYTDRATSVVSCVDQHFPRYPVSVYIDCAGQNDIITESKTAAQVLALAEANADARRAAGADKVLITTVPPGTIPTWYSSAQNTVRVAYNVLLRANTNAKFDGVVDFDAAPHAADPTDTTYYIDGLHPNNALAAEWAVLTHAAIVALGVPL